MDDGGGDGGTGARRGRTAGPAEISLEGELEDKWGDLAEEEEKATRRKADGSGLLAKLLQSVTKHKWAHPFKRPVTEKELTLTLILALALTLALALALTLTLTQPHPNTHPN